MTIYQTISLKKLNKDEIYNILNREIIDFKFKKNYENEIIDVCLSKKLLINLYNYLTIIWLKIQERIFKIYLWKK